MPLIADNRIIFAGTNRGVVCLSRKSGKLIWKYEPYSDREESFFSEPIEYNGYLFLLNFEGSLHKVSTKSGKLKYCVKLILEKSGYFYANPALKSGKIYAISNNGCLVCADMNSGGVIWTASLSEGSVHALQVSRNSLVIQVKTCIFVANLKSKKIESFKFNSIVDFWVKKEVFYVLDKKSNDSSSTVLFEYKKKRKSYLNFPD